MHPKHSGKTKQQKREERADLIQFQSIQNAAMKLVDEVHQQVMDNCKLLEAQFVRFDSKRDRFKSPFATNSEVWIHWLEYEIEKYEQDRFAGLDNLETFNPMQLWKASNATEFWKSYDLFDEIAAVPWKVRFSEYSYARLVNFPSFIKQAVLKKTLELGIGWIRNKVNVWYVSKGPCSLMAFFTVPIEQHPDHTLLVASLLDRLPIIRNNKCVQYTFEHYLKVIDFLSRGSDAKYSIEAFLNTIKNDPDRWVEDSNVEENQSYNSVFDPIMRKVGNYYYPKIIHRLYLSADESDNLRFDENKKRWIAIDENKVVESAESEAFHNKLVKRLAETSSCYDFLNLLNTLPNFKIRLTEEQQNLVGCAGNVLAIGRSGTGKTTCSLLRLFSAEIVYKFRSQRGKRKLGPDDIDKASALHSVFVTASPVLTNEVWRYHEKLNFHIKNELKIKEDLRKAHEMDLSEIKLEKQRSEIIEDTENEEEEEYSHTGPSSMTFLTDEDFPLFVTVRRLIFMIDASLRKPFFARSLDGNVIGSSVNFEWHNEYKGALEINRLYKHQRKTQEIEGYQDSDSDYDEDEATEAELQDIKNNVLSHQFVNERKRKDAHMRKTSYEVDFKIFKEKFWPKIRYKTHISALVLWTEITAYIKGSATSYSYVGYYLPKNAYAYMGRKTSLLTREEKLEIWDLFIEYEKWKVREGAYDFQDIVNYLLYQIKFTGYNGIPIHYMMVDEVQDLTAATLSLLITVTQQKLFFSGDTAQTIAKGVGFRFCDLSGLFDESNLNKPAVCQLTMNFRTHNQILGLANAVVSLLEALFPQTIDKMGKEKSPFDGPPPIFIDSTSTDHLLTVLFGSYRPQDLAEVQFGCNQVVIVRTQEAKGKLHPNLHNALCLTVFEAKGLEFDDVILYNFFNDSEISRDKWRILSQMEKLEDDPNYVPTTLEDLENHLPKLKCKDAIDQSRYSLLCTELKHLYVAITRPKVRLIIYDDNPESRRYIEEYWEYMGAISSTNIIESSTPVDILGCDGIAQKSSQEAWKTQGLRMMSHKFYDQAAKCFSASGDKNLESKALAYAFANKASEILCEAIALEDSEYTENKKLTIKDKKALKSMKKDAKIKFKQAGELFLDLSLRQSSRVLTKQAARCFASAEEHEKAAGLFREGGLIAQAAEAYYSSGFFETAGDLFAEKKEYIRAIESYRRGMNWDKLVHCIYDFRNDMTLKERQKYIQKYVPVALEALMPKILPKNEKETAYEAQIVEEDKKMIKEVDEDEESDSEEEILEQKEIVKETVIGSENFLDEMHVGEIEEENRHGGNCEEGSQKWPESICEETSEIIENSMESKIEPFEEIKKEESIIEGEKASESSFVLLNNSASFSIISSDSQSQQFELIDDDDIDPDDEWLQVETGSIVDSLGSAIQKDGSIMSDYSIIDNVHATALNLGGKLIMTKADIFIEDEAMRKIIEYVGMFSEDVSTYLKSLRSAESLISSQHLTEDWQLASLVDLDDMSAETLGMILDTLEDFGMFKMCLIVCNRYNLATRLGRYVTSLAFKYSNLTTLKSHEIFRPQFIHNQGARAAIAYTAVHNVFEMINPEYLALKERLDMKCLGLEGFQGLLLLGYWKKLIYIMDKENSLALASTFGDFKNYKNVYLTFSGKESNIAEKISKEDFSWLPFETPQNQEEIEATKIAFYSVISMLNSYEKSLTVLNSKTINFLPCFKYNDTLWNLILNKDKAGFEKTMMNSFKDIKRILNMKEFSLIDELEILDVFSFYSQMLLYTTQHPNLEFTWVIWDIFQNLSYPDIQIFLQCTSGIIKYLRHKDNNSIHLSTQYNNIIFSLLTPFGIRKIIPSEVTSALPSLSHAIVNKQSILIKNMNVSSIPDTYIADLEGQNLLIPIKSLKIQLKNEIFSMIDSLLKHRSKILNNYTFGDDEFKWKEISHEIVYHASNLYGEMWMLDFMKADLPYRVNSYSQISSLDIEGEKEYLETKKELKKLFEIAGDDEISTIFVKINRNNEIKKYEKKLAYYERKKGIMGSNRNDILSKIFENCKYLYGDFKELTDIARHALLTQAQFEMARSDSSQEDTAMTESVWLAFELCKISGYEVYFQEMLKRRYRPVLKFSGKIPKLSQNYQYALAYLDIEVYYKTRCFEDTSMSILSLFEVQSKEMSISHKLNLIERAVTLWAISLGKDIILPKYLYHHIPEHKISENIIYLDNVIKGNSKSLPIDLIKFVVELINDINLLSYSTETKEEQLTNLFDNLITLFMYGPNDMLYEIQGLSIENKIEISSAFTCIPQTVKFLLRANNIVMLQDLQKSYREKQIEPNEMLITHTNNGNIEDANSMLNQLWYSEVKILAKRQRSYGATKTLKKSKINYKKFTTALEASFFSSIYSYIPFENRKDLVENWDKMTMLGELLESIQKYHSELLSINYKTVLTKALDMHFILSQFNMVSSQIKKLKDCITYDFENYINSLATEVWDNFRESAFRRLFSWKSMVMPKNEEENKGRKKWNIGWTARFFDRKQRNKKQRKRR